MAGQSLTSDSATDENPRRTNSARFSRRKRALFLLILWGGIFGAAEVGARIYYAASDQNIAEQRYKFGWRRNHRIAKRWPGQERDYPYLPYIPKIKAPDVEMRGLRLTTTKEIKPPDVFRLFCLGGSTTYLGYPAKLEDNLRADFAERGLRLEVVNAANISWTTCESLTNFTMRCLHYEPDAIIVYHAANDASAAFGKTFKPAYAHWRKRLIANGPLLWDRVPRVMDYSVSYMMLRGWAEARSNLITWTQTVMHYIPDFENDPYHGIETYRTNMRSLIAVAAEHNVRTIIATQVCNDQVPQKRFVKAVHEINDVTRELARNDDRVHLVDSAAKINGNDELMFDICHFRIEKDGEDRLIQLFAESVRSQLDDWIARRNSDSGPVNATSSAQAHGSH